MSYHDVTTLTTPQSAFSVIQRTKKYLEHMVLTRKQVDHIALNRGDYDQILRSVNSARKKHGQEPADSLCIGAVTLTRGPR